MSHGWQEQLVFEHLCIWPPLPLFATFEPLDGTTVVGVAEPLPPLFHLGTEAPTAALPLSLATLKESSAGSS